MSDNTGDELLASTGFRELFRYRKSTHLRIYGLSLTPSSGAELWRITQVPDEPTMSVKEADLKSAEEAVEALHEIGICLKAAGWKEVLTPHAPWRDS